MEHVRIQRGHLVRAPLPDTLVGMIFDSLENARLYRGLGARIESAIEYLSVTDFSELETGRHEVDGDSVYALVQRTTTVEDTERLYESHRRYLDIQYVIEGCECIRFHPVSGLDVSKPYDGESDIVFYARTAGADLILDPGYFAVFYPQDAHMPLLACDITGPLTKVVMKVLAG